MSVSAPLVIVVVAVVVYNMSAFVIIDTFLNACVCMCALARMFMSEIERGLEEGKINRKHRRRFPVIVSATLTYHVVELEIRSSQFIRICYI